MSFTAVAGAGSELIGTIGGIFGGGLGAGERWAQDAGRQAANLSVTQARQAWDAVGARAAQRVLDFPPLSRFCPTDNLEIACSDDLDQAAWSSAGGFQVADTAASVLRAVGISQPAGKKKESIEVAKIVLAKWNPAADAPRNAGATGSGGGGGGGGAFGVSTTALVALGALGVVLFVGRG